MKSKLLFLTFRRVCGVLWAQDLHGITVGRPMRFLITGLMVYAVSLVIILAGFYSYEHSKVGRLAPRVILIMTQMSALYALAPATVYVLLRQLLSKHR